MNKAIDKNKSLKPQCMGDLLSQLLDHNVREAKVFAKSLVKLDGNEKERSRAIFAASALVSHADDAGWSVVWPFMEKDVEFGQDVMLAIERSPGRRSKGTLERFAEDQLADLYIWIVRQYHQYHYSENPEYEEAHSVTPEENIANWSDSILNHLKERGSLEAVEAIKRIYREFPEKYWLKWTILDAQYIARYKTWTPPLPEYLLHIARDEQKRLVESGDQLLDLVIESLKDLEEKLQGELPASRDIWDRVDKKPDKYRPKDEDEFSDYVARHLKEHLGERGVIIGREVQIHRRERTDIHVDAIKLGSSSDSYDSVTVIIEVKGCWHPELDNAMETQLVGRYLKNNRCRHGIYLVGWFNCDQWDSEDSKRRPKIGLGEAREKFQGQADELSKEGTKIRAFVMDTALR